MANREDPELPTPKFDADMPDYSDPSGDDFAALSRDRVPVRSLREDDLSAIIRIDRKLTGNDRTPYYEHKLVEVMRESGVRVSLVAELDDRPVGYIMARVDFGEFGHTEPAAVIDTIGVDPGHARHGIARALLSQLLANLASLHVETVRTVVMWDSFPLLRFLADCGFAPGQHLVLTRTID